MSTRKIMIRLNQLMSQTCAISNRVKQGGVLSPILSSVYVDNLIRILKDSKIECMYNNEYMGFLRMQMISVYCVLPFLEYKKNVTYM